MSEAKHPETSQASRWRNGIRIDTDLWVRVIGRDGGARRRTGNISGTGFFFETATWSGRPGDICVMEIWSGDRLQGFTTVASLVRVVCSDDAGWSSLPRGVSFRFHPSDEATRTAIARTVRHIAEQHPEQASELHLEDFEAWASDEVYRGLSENAQPVIEAGTRVRLVVGDIAGEEPSEVTGVVGEITESVQADGATRYWVPVFLEGGGGPAESERECGVGTESDARSDASAIGPVPGATGSLIDTMWRELVPEARSLIAEKRSGSSPTGLSHLSGKLSQISMPSALWLLEHERLSGAIEFRRDAEQIVLFLIRGRVIDAESPGSQSTPRELLKALMGWNDGEFEFRVEEVEREDRLGVPTQGLLLDLAVETDDDK